VAPVERMQSIKSNALEPTRSEWATLSRWQAIVRLASVYGLPLLTLALIVFFSLLLPDTFPTWLNARSILADKAIIAMLSLAATLPMMAGRIDLTVGFGIVMWHILAISLQVKLGVPWPLAIVIVIACGGSEKDQIGFAAAWRRLTMPQPDAGQPAKPSRVRALYPVN